MSGSGPSYGSLLEGPLPGVGKKGANLGNLLEGDLPGINRKGPILGTILESALPGVGKNVIVVNYSYSLTHTPSNTKLPNFVFEGGISFKQNRDGKES
jgi:hypothetical protein